MCTQCKHIDEVPSMHGIQVEHFTINHWRNLLQSAATHADEVQTAVNVCALAAQHNTPWLCEHGAHRSAFGVLTARVAAGHTYMSAYEQLRDTLCMQMLVYVTI